MKTLVSLSTILLFTNVFLSQTIAQETVDDEIIGGKYYFRTTPSFETNGGMKLGKDSPLPDDVQIKLYQKVRITDTHTDRVYFKYLDFTREELRKIYNVDTDGKSLIFSLSQDDFQKYTKVYYNKFRGVLLGTYSVPIRIRSSKGNYEFDSNVSLGASLITRWSLNRVDENLFVDLSFGVGLTKVNLNSENSILGDEGTDFADIDVLSPSALTYSFGLTFNLAKRVNFGAYYGWDFLSSADQKAGWIYNRKPWIGIGLGIVFSDNGNGSSSESGKNSPK